MDTATDLRQDARILRDQAREVSHDIEEARQRVQMAERMQWQIAGRSRQGERGRTVAALAIVQRIKTKTRKEIARMESDKQNMEKDAAEKEREAKQQQEKQREQAKQRQAEKKRQRSASRDRDNDHDRDPF